MTLFRHLILNVLDFLEGLFLHFLELVQFLIGSLLLSRGLRRENAVNTFLLGHLIPCLPVFGVGINGLYYLIDFVIVKSFIVVSTAI